jgi:2-dehydro-3-deoxyphosphogluconate aldolase / (4S)-4-hydroxy-2-oxoglutarate aldolase
MIMSIKKDEIINRMGETGMIPVFYQPDADLAKSIIDACYAGGVRVFEFTNRGDKAFPVFASLIHHIRQYKDAVLGIGTIMNVDDTKRYCDAGAHFIVSPILKTSMSSTCEENGVNWIPGCATLTEIVTAHEAGAEVIKLFPGSVLGPGFVSAVKPVIPQIKLMPTGGVEPTEKSLSAWFKAGVFCVGMGSQLVGSDTIAQRNWKLLEQQARQAMETIRTIRSQK